MAAWPQCPHDPSSICGSHSVLLATKFPDEGRAGTCQPLGPTLHLKTVAPLQVAFCPLDTPESSLVAGQEDSLPKLCTAWGLHRHLSGMKERLFKMQALGPEASLLGELRAGGHFGTGTAP